LMRPGVPAVEVSTTLEEVYRLHLQHTPTITVPVLQRGKLWGAVNLPALRTVEPSAWADTPASHITRPLAPEDVIAGEQPLFDAVLLMERADKEFLWVTEEGRLIGVIFREDARRTASQSERDRQ
jgi:CBS domain-containing protein